MPQRRPVGGRARGRSRRQSGGTRRKGEHDWLRGRSRGQALVEFALVAPLFFLIFFSIIEFALIMAAMGGYNFAVRDGARVGALLGRTSATADAQIVSTVRSHVLGLVMAQASEVDIYRSTSDGQCLSAPIGTVATVSVDNGACAKDQYNLDGTCQGGTCGGAGWPINDRNDSLTSADYLGVRVKYTYTYLTAFIAMSGSSLALDATSVQRIEPQGFSQRAPATASAAGRAGPRSWGWLTGEWGWTIGVVAADVPRRDVPRRDVPRYDVQRYKSFGAGASRAGPGTTARTATACARTVRCTTG
jgi:Flp pilus assembly protein TadG